MEELIKQAFVQVEDLGPHVQDGRYDLTGPDGEIILPQVWDIVVRPDWEVTMHLWPMEEEKKKSPDIDSMIDPFGGMGLGGYPGLGGGSGSGDKDKIDLSQWLPKGKYKALNIGGMSIKAYDGITGPMGPSIWEKVSNQYQQQKPRLIPER